MKDANPKPCAQCPWRTANQGTPHPHGFYAKKNLRRLWAGLRTGERMTCHPTDSRMAEFEGYEHTAEREHLHECAGALILVQREMVRLQDEMQGAERDGVAAEGYKRYRKLHPRGILREGYVRIAFAISATSNPITGPHARTMDLNVEGVGHPDLSEWTPRKEPV